MDCCDPKQFRSTQPKFSCESGSFDRARCLIAATVLHLQNQQQCLKDRSNKHRSPSRFLWKCLAVDHSVPKQFKSCICWTKIHCSGAVNGPWEKPGLSCCKTLLVAEHFLHEAKQVKQLFFFRCLVGASMKLFILQGSSHPNDTRTHNNQQPAALAGGIF